MVLLKPDKNMSDAGWKAARQKIFLAENEAHIWRIALFQKDKVLEFSADLLDENEKSKAAKFRFERDRRNYIAAHGAMREILGFYLECCPKKIEFTTNYYGKPFLRRNQTDINFNMSHSHEWALLALTKGKKIGVDIELIRAEIAEQNLAEQIFSPLENETLRNLPEKLRLKAFFDCWTRKEAFIKAVGKGLSYPLEEFAVSCAPHQSAMLLSINNSSDEVENWHIKELNVGENYAAAAAIESKQLKLKFYHWECSKNI